ncbi:hypothetical protein CYLTODRAFT_458705 [Cylindrobasidium torrendii FP15055 ss-10]|uniref:Uncharacterized protein n=1 Tax=Cylindrobasidium torrendii FP15055 ss-10 TaxID=1314674 RepID=A0A0D7AY09_9AGAR|nr:hypothetical protein CYLTODRAFT_458705 [Cylindrobasidium torrendii FP15055 ss-10]
MDEAQYAAERKVNDKLRAKAEKLLCFAPDQHETVLAAATVDGWMEDLPTMNADSDFTMWAEYDDILQRNRLRAHKQAAWLVANEAWLDAIIANNAARQHAASGNSRSLPGILPPSLTPSDVLHSPSYTSGEGIADDYISDLLERMSNEITSMGIRMGLRMELPTQK